MKIKDILLIVCISFAIILSAYGISHADATPMQVADAQSQVMQSKCNLQFSSDVREHFMSRYGFTDEEAEIYRMRSRGYSLVRISIETGYSEATIQGRIRKIKKKMLSI